MVSFLPFFQCLTNSHGLPVIIITIKFSLQTGVHHLALWGSVAFAFLFNYVYCAIDSQQRFIDTLWVMQQTSARAEFWFTMLLSTVLALFPR